MGQFCTVPIHGMNTYRSVSVLLKNAADGMVLWCILTGNVYLRLPV